MRKKAFLNVAASSLLLGVTMVGCSGGAAMMARPGVVTDPAERQALASAAIAEKALAKRDVAAAMAAAETAVAAKPDNARYRQLLGRAYLADGRFISAETALSDAMTLGNSDARTIVSLSLAKVALGNSLGARELLAANLDHVPATDYGLAMAMAGDTNEAIRILSAAAQEPEAIAKTRQNLAYAYALAGQWREARLMAAQDLDPMAATQRIIGWAQNAEAGSEPQRVAAFIGTQMRADDAGLPTRLALASSAPMRLAQADVAPQTVSVEQAVEIAEVAEVASPDVPFVAAPEEPVRVVDVHPTPVARAVTMMRKAALIVPVEPSATSNWVVQLGAYNSVGIAKERWQHMTRANAQLRRFPVFYSTANVQGRLYHRLAMGGFGDRMSAYQMCRTIRSQGGACFIRAAAPVKLWAAAMKPKRQQLASR